MENTSAGLLELRSTNLKSVETRDSREERENSLSLGGNTLACKGAQTAELRGYRTGDPIIWRK